MHTVCSLLRFGEDSVSHLGSGAFRSMGFPRDIVVEENEVPTLPILSPIPNFI